MCWKCSVDRDVREREQLWVIMCLEKGCNYATVTSRMANLTAETRAARHMTRRRHTVLRQSTGPDQTVIVHKPSQTVTLPLDGNPPF